MTKTSKTEHEMNKVDLQWLNELSSNIEYGDVTHFFVTPEAGGFKITPNDNPVVVDAEEPNHALLSEHEVQWLKTCELCIQKGRAAHQLVSIAFCIIQQKKLFRAHYKSFTEYCEKRWGYTRDNGYKLSEAGRVLIEMAQSGATVFPESTRAARFLSNLPNEDREPLVRSAVENAGAATSATLKKELQKSQESLTKAAKPKNNGKTKKCDKKEEDLAEEAPLEKTEEKVLPFPPAGRSLPQGLKSFGELRQLAQDAFDIVGQSGAEIKLTDILSELKKQLGMRADWEKENVHYGT